MGESRSARFALDGLVCLVTGGGAGIGEAVAKVLAAQGGDVVVNDIDATTAERTSMSLGDGAAGVAPGDMTQPDQARRVVEQVHADHGRLDILVNNASAHVELHGFVHSRPETWSAGLGSLWATLACTHAALPGMLARKFGRVVNVTSISGVFGVPQMVVYGAAKGGIHAFAAGLAKEVASAGVTVNCVAPGTVDTPRQRARDPEVQAARRAQIPLARFANAQEVADTVAFLASREASYITGETLLVDGGRP